MAARETLLLLVLVLSLSRVVNSFNPLFAFDRKSITHREITQRALLRKTAEVCQCIATSRGFSLTIGDSLSADDVQRTCFSIGTSTSILSAMRFHAAITTIYLSNAKVDMVYELSGKHHFDNETFKDGRQVITTGTSAVKASVKLKKFVAGRWLLGGILHTLQDFYSHSNWVELGRTVPYSTLIKPDQPLENLAGPNTPTCRSCAEGDCENNLLPEVLQQGLLTSGYFSIFSSAKPPGKCSHGGFFDRTSRQDPVGGINKDAAGASHGSRHQKAADLAVDASVELLEDIRAAVGDKSFLELMGLSQSSALCFVIDTTGSMSDDIAEAKRISFSIIDSKRGTLQEPSVYILVPFNDPGFGPLIVTTNADVFKDKFNELTASGTSDSAMVLSGLQLALTAAPDSSDIFVFTDAPAKDSHLKSTITALIESRKSVVTFMLTDVGSRRRRRSPRALSETDAQVFKDLAKASGGQAIEISKSELFEATKIIEDSSASAVVTVFQVVRNPGRPDNFTFTVDGSLRNVTIYITGVSTLTFRLISATGKSQTSSQSSGPLASITTAGNLRRLSLNTDNQTGSWEIRVDSTSQYSVKVTGQSSVNFIFNLMEVHEGRVDFSLKEGRPLSGGNVSLLLSVTGGDSVAVTDVTLFDSSGPTQVNGSLQSLGNNTVLVTFTKVPAGEYVVRLSGEDVSSSSISFQRQAPTRIKTANHLITAHVNSTSIEPGATVVLPITVVPITDGVVDHSANPSYTLRAFSDRPYAIDSLRTSTSPAWVGIVSLTVPSDAASGTDVTLTIEVKDSHDIAYAVLRFSVAAEVTDVTRPVCRVVSSSINCSSSSSLCNSSMWVVTANFTDGTNGSGIESVTVRQGNGTLTTDTVAGAGGENVTVVTYSASCCSESAELIAVDGIGNVGTCALKGFTPEIAAVGGTTSTGGHIVDLSYWLWISVAVCLFWK